jgi:hypothetical protein
VLIRPLRGTHPDNLLKTLQHACTATENLDTAHHSSADERRRSYIEWANDTAGQFRGGMSRADIDRLILTPPFWHIQALPSPLPDEARTTINTEIATRRAELEKLYMEVTRQVAQWSIHSHYVVPDTTMFIQHPDKLEDWDLAGITTDYAQRPLHVLIPMVVIDELDRLKEASKPRTRWRARYSLAVLDRVLQDPRKPGTLRPLQFPQSRGSLTVELVFDAPGHVRLPEPDDEIVDQAAMIESLAGPNVTLLTYDTGQSTRARAAGLTCHKLSDPPEGDEPAKK